MTEVDLYEQLAQYLNLKYPNVLYHFDLAGVNNPSHYSRNLYGRLNRRAWPDLFIAASQLRPNEITAYYGLFIELKRDGTQLYKQDGSLRLNAHHAEQQAVLELLRRQGYRAEFAVGLEAAIKLIDDYLV